MKTYEDLCSRLRKIGMKRVKAAHNYEVVEGPANVCLSGKDKRTLFITARTSLYAIRMRVGAT